MQSDELRPNKMVPQIVMEYAVIVDDFMSEGATELTVYRGDFVHVLYHIDCRWAYICRQCDKHVGYVPYLFCTFITPLTYVDNKSHSSSLSSRQHHQEILPPPLPLLSRVDYRISSNSHSVTINSINPINGSCSSGRSSSEECVIPSNYAPNYNPPIPCNSSDSNSNSNSSTNSSQLMKKTRSEPDGNSWVDNEVHCYRAVPLSYQNYVPPPSPYYNRHIQANNNNEEDEEDDQITPQISASHSFTGKILAAKPEPRYVNCIGNSAAAASARSGSASSLSASSQPICEPYKTIVHELEDCLEKLTLV